MWGLENYTCLETFTLEGDHPDFVNSLAFADDNLFYVSSFSQTIVKLDSKSGSCLGTFEGDSIGNSSVVPANDGKLFSASYEGAIKMWDLEEGTCLRTFQGHEKGTTSLVYADNKLFSGGLDGMIKIWDSTDGTC